MPIAVTVRSPGESIGGQPDAGSGAIDRPYEQNLLSVSMINPDWLTSPAIYRVAESPFAEVRFDAARDGSLARRIPDGLYHEITQNLPVLCCDVLAVSKNRTDQFSVLTIERALWPLEGHRWMLGGRQCLPPVEHPLSSKWSLHANALLVLFNEAGIQPQQVSSLHSLGFGEYRFERERLDGNGQPFVERRHTPSVTMVAMLEGVEPPAISLDSQSRAPLWLSREDFEYSEIGKRLCSPMQEYLGAIFAAETNR